MRYRSLIKKIWGSALIPMGQSSSEQSTVLVQPINCPPFVLRGISGLKVEDVNGKIYTSAY
jgi:hypothetical protein